MYLTIFRPNFDRRIWLYYTSKFSAISCIMYSARLKTFDLVHPNFKGTCIEFINVIMQVCWHFKKGLDWNCQGYFLKNSVKCKSNTRLQQTQSENWQFVLTMQVPFGDLHCTNTCPMSQISAYCRSRSNLGFPLICFG